jgi:predicted nucleic acid-binding protein
MNLYLDSSALVKQYIRERGSDDVRRWITDADYLATSIIAIAEINAAFARGMRMRSFSQSTAEKAVELLHVHWPGYLKIPASEKCIHRAADLAWKLGLRGYDAVHVASAELWQDALNAPITFVAYDKQLVRAVHSLGINVIPELEA